MSEQQRAAYARGPAEHQQADHGDRQGRGDRQQSGERQRQQTARQHRPEVVLRAVGIRGEHERGDEPARVVDDQHPADLAGACVEQRHQQQRERRVEEGELESPQQRRGGNEEALHGATASHRRPLKHARAVRAWPCDRGTDRPPLGGRGRRRLPDVDRTSDISEFLTSRRARVTPEQAGLPKFGRRRVPGLRREEVASLAGVSVEYYKRLERGNLRGVSDMVLEAVARALRLDDAERTHLFDLARAAGPAAPTRRRAMPQRVRPSVQRMLDALTRPRTSATTAATSSPPTRSDRRSTPRCTATRSGPSIRFASSSSTLRAQDFFLDWEASPTTRWRACASRPAATRTTAACRTSSASCRPAATSSALAGRRTTCASTSAGPKRLHHPIVGELDLTSRRWTSPADAGLTFVTYSAEPGSRSEEGLALLASWTATLQQEAQAGTGLGARDAPSRTTTTTTATRRHEPPPRPRSH